MLYYTILVIISIHLTFPFSGIKSAYAIEIAQALDLKLSQAYRGYNTKTCLRHVAEDKAQLNKAKDAIAKKKHKDYMSSDHRKVVRAQLQEESKKQKQALAEISAEKLRNAEECVAASNQTRPTLKPCTSSQGKFCFCPQGVGPRLCSCSRTSLGAYPRSGQGEKESQDKEIVRISNNFLIYIK